MVDGLSRLLTVVDDDSEAALFVTELRGYREKVGNCFGTRLARKFVQICRVCDRHYQ
jgi:hypothetical protein